MISSRIISHLPFLAAVGRAKSFTHAAETMRVTQSAISYQIKQLEEKLGLTLVLRQAGATTALTTAGQALVDEFLVIEKRLEFVLDDVGAAQARGTLRVSAPIDFGSTILPFALQALADIAPNLTVELETSDQLCDPMRDQIDIAIRSAASGPDLVHKPIIKARKVLVASKSYLERRETPKGLNDLRHQTILSRSPAFSASWQQLSLDLGINLAEFQPPLSIGNTYAMAQGVRAGIGIAILPQYMVATDIEEGSLSVLLANKLPPLHTPFFLSHIPVPQINTRVRALAKAIGRTTDLPQFQGCFSVAK